MRTNSPIKASNAQSKAGKQARKQADKQQESQQASKRQGATRAKSEDRARNPHAWQRIWGNESYSKQELLHFTHTHNGLTQLDNRYLSSKILHTCPLTKQSLLISISIRHRALNQWSVSNASQVCRSGTASCRSGFPASLLVADLVGC